MTTLDVCYTQQHANHVSSCLASFRLSFDTKMIYFGELLDIICNKILVDYNHTYSLYVHWGMVGGEGICFIDLFQFLCAGEMVGCISSRNLGLML